MEVEFWHGCTRYPSRWDGSQAVRLTCEPAQGRLMLPQIRVCAGYSGLSARRRLPVQRPAVRTAWAQRRDGLPPGVAGAVLLGLACLVCRVVALISEIRLATQERKTLFTADRSCDLLADGLELLEDGGLSERSWSHASQYPRRPRIHATTDGHVTLPREDWP
jgi:hypothetical protein